MDIEHCDANDRRFVLFECNLFAFVGGDWAGSRNCAVSGSNWFGWDVENVGANICVGSEPQGWESFVGKV